MKHEKSRNISIKLVDAECEWYEQIVEKYGKVNHLKLFIDSLSKVAEKNDKKYFRNTKSVEDIGRV